MALLNASELEYSHWLVGWLVGTPNRLVIHSYEALGGKNIIIAQ